MVHLGLYSDRRILDGRKLFRPPLRTGNTTRLFSANDIPLPRRIRMSKPVQARKGIFRCLIDERDDLEVGHNVQVGICIVESSDSVVYFIIVVE